MEAKMEKDADSMVVKPVEYAASEYSSSSEPPPAYRLRQANSVKIAKIVAFTVILSSFILGSFMLGSTYLQAKATCDQVSALDAILDKELMLETMQQDLPRSEALLSQDNDDSVANDLSKDEMNKPNKKDVTNPDDVENIHSENTDEDEETNDIDSEMKRVHIKLPLDFDLSELAHNIMMNNQKSRMNCVVERRRTEEVEEPKPMNPFNVFMNEPKKEKVTGERIAIFCESGAPKSEPEPVMQIRRIVMPFQFANPMNRFGPQMGPGPQFQQPPMNGQFPPQFPPQFMNQMNMPPPQMNMNMPPPQMNMPGQQMNFQSPPQMRMPFQPQNMQFPQEQLPPIPAPMMSPPRPEVPQFRLINPAPQQQQLPNFERPQMPNFERPQMPNFERPQMRETEQPEQQPELRIHLRRIQIPGNIGDILPFLNNMQSNVQNDAPKEVEAPRQNVQFQQMPLAMALSKVGITPDDLRNIQRMAEEKFQEHIRDLVADEDGDSDSDSSESEEDKDSGMATVVPDQDSVEETQKNEPNQQASSQQEQSDEERPQILALGRSNFGRSLNPIQLPAHMTENAEIQDFVHPR